MSESHFLMYALVFIVAFTAITTTYAQYEVSIKCPDQLAESIGLRGLDVSNGTELTERRNDIWANLGTYMNPQCSGMPYWIVAFISILGIVILIKVLPFVG